MVGLQQGADQLCAVCIVHAGASKQRHAQQQQLVLARLIGVPQVLVHLRWRGFASLEGRHTKVTLENNVGQSADAQL